MTATARAIVELPEKHSIDRFLPESYASTLLDSILVDCKYMIPVEMPATILGTTDAHFMDSRNFNTALKQFARMLLANQDLYQKWIKAVYPWQTFFQDLSLVLFHMIFFTCYDVYYPDGLPTEFQHAALRFGAIWYLNFTKTTQYKEFKALCALRHLDYHVTVNRIFNK